MATPRGKKTKRKEKAPSLCGRCHVVLAAAPAALKVGRGRKPLLTRALIIAIGASLARSGSKKRACAANGITRETLYDWDAKGKADIAAGNRSLYAEFSDTLSVADPMGEDGLWAAVEAGSTTGSEEDFRRGRLALQAIALRDARRHDVDGEQAATQAGSQVRRFDLTRLPPAERLEFQRMYRIVVGMEEPAQGQADAARS